MQKKVSREFASTKNENKMEIQEKHIFTVKSMPYVSMSLRL